MADLIAGQYHFNFSGLQGSQVQVRAGRLRHVCEGWYQRKLVLQAGVSIFGLASLGALIATVEASGGVRGFVADLERRDWINTPRRVRLLTFAVGLGIFWSIRSRRRSAASWTSVARETSPRSATRSGIGRDRR